MNGATFLATCTLMTSYIRKSYFMNKHTVYVNIICVLAFSSGVYFCPQIFIFCGIILEPDNYMSLME